MTRRGCPRFSKEHGERRLGGHRLSLAGNETHMEKNGFVSKVHFRRRAGSPLTAAQAKANAARSKVRSAVETVFAAQKHRFGLFVRTIGAARARVKIGLANIAYNVTRFVWLTIRPAAA